MLKERVILRAVEKKDIDFILLCENDTSVWSEGANTRFYSRYAIENYVESVQNTDIFSSCQSRMMIDITSPNGVKTVGCADLYDIDARHSRAGVGIYIEESYRNKGYAKLSLLQTEEYAFNVLNLYQLYAFVGADNTYSQRLFAGCGYEKTAVLKDWTECRGVFRDVYVFQKRR